MATPRQIPAQESPSANSSPVVGGAFLATPVMRKRETSEQCSPAQASLLLSIEIAFESAHRKRHREGVVFFARCPFSPFATETSFAYVPT